MHAESPDGPAIIAKSLLAARSPHEGCKREETRKTGGTEGLAPCPRDGSHHVNYEEGRRERLVIPIHGNESLKIGLLRNLMKIIPVSGEEL